MFWDKVHLKALLRLHRYPLRLIDQEPWKSWIQIRGGLNAVYDYLRTCALSDQQRELLELILAYPDVLADFYANRLYIGLRTYFRRLDELLSVLLQCLNTWSYPPPARSCGNLPIPMTAMVGAEEVVKAVCSLLLRSDVRLVTLTGTGGVGKTRLAIEVASQLIARFADGICFMPLASIDDHSLLVAQIARSLGVEASGEQSLFDVLKFNLRKKRFLLVLDNFEHLIAAGPLIAELLASTQYLKVLVTSREILGLYGEHRFEVPLLSLPEGEHFSSLDRLQEYSAVRLFVERAQAVYSGFTLTEDNANSVVEICRRLDGLPLAIELAAARAYMFPPAKILAELERPLQFLHSGPQDNETRHQTLWNVMDWSYNLLDEDEQMLFRHLAVFANGWDIAAATAVVGQIMDVESKLDALIRKSLVRVVNTQHITNPRFQMLATVRAYATDRLEASQEGDYARQRHASYYLTLVEEAEPYVGVGQQSVWFEQIEREHENLRAALTWMLNNAEAEMALRMVGSAWRFWHVLNILSEGRYWVDRALYLGRHVRTEARIKALLGAGWLALSQGGQARTFFEEGLALALDLGIRRFLPSLLQGLGAVIQNSDPQTATIRFKEGLSIARELGDEIEVAWALDHLGQLQQKQGNYVQACVLLEESLTIFRKLGHRLGIAFVLDHLGRAMLEQDKWEESRVFLEKALVYIEAFGVRLHLPWTLAALAHAVLNCGDLVLAKSFLENALRLHRESKNFLGVELVLSGFALLAATIQDYKRSVQLGGAVGAILGITDPVGPFEIRSYAHRVLEKILSVTRAYLDEQSFFAAWMGGQIMTVEEAIAFALAN